MHANKQAQLAGVTRGAYLRIITRSSGVFAFAWLALAAQGQQVLPDPGQASHLTSSETVANGRHDLTANGESRRILGVIPNYKTLASGAHYEPLTVGEKFKVASEDSLDRGTIALAAFFGGIGQLSGDNKSFGQGVAGYSKYFGSAYGDLLIGNYMTEAVFPSVLHQDPRYFRRGTGSGRSRFAYALSRVMWTRTDSDKEQFNYSEWLGNSAGVAISTAYYRDQRSAGKAISKLGMQISVDAVANVLKEFWPDLQRKFHRRAKPVFSSPGE